MSPPVKCPKLLDEVRDGEKIDRISSLCDEVLGHILSFLPTKYSVRTSVLSTRWRYLFRLTNSLDFYAPILYGCDSKEEMEVQRRSFEMFVYRVLALHKAPLEKFSLCSEYSFDDSHIDFWIDVALLKEVQELNIDFRGQFKMSPHYLFNCQTLVTLKISASWYGFDFKVPGSVCLPRLKVLQLEEVRIIDGDSVSKFISGCSLLEKLALICCQWTMSKHAYIYAGALKDLRIICDGPADVEIDAPSLAYLTYECGYIDDIPYYFTNSYYLLNARLELRLKWPYDSASRALKLIRGASNVTKLHLLHDALLALNKAKYDGIPTYPYLITLCVSVCSCDSWECMMYWLANSPRLENIFIQQALYECEGDREWSPVNVALAAFQTHVKKITIYNFYGDKMGLTVLEFLLRNARELEKVILYKHEQMTMKRELRASKRLLTVPRASTDCCIHLKEEPYPITRSF